MASMQALEEQETDTDEDGTSAPEPMGKEEQKHRFIMMRAKGYSYARIAAELKVSKGTLTAWSAELETEVAKARTVELEALQEEFFLLKEGRIRLIGEQLKAIQTEIDKRDLALCRGFYRGCILAQWACKDACLQIVFLDHTLQDVEKRRTVELSESFGPRVVTRRQYEGIVAVQREKKLEFEYSLGYVIERRFYAVAPPEAQKEIGEAGADTGA